MQYCLNINPTLDKTIEVGTLELGATNRAEAVRVDAGGKAINVARVLKVLGGDPKVVGFVYTNGGDVIKNALEDASVFYDFHEEEGVPRVNTKIVSTSQGRVTEINEVGAPVREGVLERIADELVDSAFAGDSVILTGGLPMGTPQDYYKKLIQRLKEKEVLVYLDASGDALKEGVMAGPYMIKPNLSELEEVSGRQIRSLGDALEAARDLITRYGVQFVVASFGGRGSLAVDAQTMAYAASLPVPVGSTVGAGDSLLAGIAVRPQASLVDKLKSGSAAAAGSVAQKGTALCTKPMYDQYYDEVVLTEGPDLNQSIVE